MRFSPKIDAHTKFSLAHQLRVARRLREMWNQGRLEIFDVESSMRGDDAIRIVYLFTRDEQIEIELTFVGKFTKAVLNGRIEPDGITVRIRNRTYLSLPEVGGWDDLWEICRGAKESTQRSRARLLPLRLKRLRAAMKKLEMDLGA